MKCLSVILGVMIVTACGGDPGDAGDSDEALASDSVTSSLEMLRHGHGDHGDVVGARAVHQAIARGAARPAGFLATLPVAGAGAGYAQPPQ